MNEKTEQRSFYPTRTGILEDTVKTIELQYVGFFCPCAQWITPDDYIKYIDTGKHIDHTVFVEPVNQALELPDTIGYPADVIRFTGQFYKNKGYPKHYPITEIKVDSAKVFRYKKYEIVTSNYKNYVSNP